MTGDTLPVMRRTPLNERSVLLLLGWSFASFASSGCSTFGETRAEEDAGPAVDGGPLEAGATDAAVEPEGLEPLVLDTFTRTTMLGFGEADLGGTWSVPAAAGIVSVQDGVGRILAKPAREVRALIGPTATAHVDLQAVVSCDSVGGANDTSLGSGLYISMVARSIAANDYYGKFIIDTGGSISVALSANVPAGEVPLVDRRVTGAAVKPNEKLRVRFQVSGTLPTRLRARVWKATDPEPAAWHAETTDGTPALQEPGLVGMSAYLSVGTTQGVVVSIDDFVVRPAP